MRLIEEIIIMMNYKYFVPSFEFRERLYLFFTIIVQTNLETEMSSGGCMKITQEPNKRIAIGTIRLLARKMVNICRNNSVKTVRNIYFNSHNVVYVCPPGDRERP